MKTLVLGGTGLIGNAIVRELINQKHNVTATCRRNNTPPNLVDLDVNLVHGDIDATGQLEQWTEGHDVVIDAATPYPLHLLYSESGLSKPTLRYARARTERIIKCISEHNAKLVHISTYLAQPDSPGLSPSGMQRRLMRMLHPYFEIKSMVENLLRQFRQQLPGVMIVQPPACLGPYDSKSKGQCLIPNLINGQYSITVDHKVNLMDTRDVAKAIVIAMEADRFNETIQLSGNNTSLSETLKYIEHYGGVERPTARMQIPAAFGVLPTYWFEFAWAAIGRPSPMPSLLPVLICEQSWLTESEAQRSLGFEVRPLAETLRDTVNWYQSIGYC